MKLNDDILKDITERLISWVKESMDNSQWKSQADCGQFS